MAEVLNQDDIDALLKAVESGEAGPATSEPMGRVFSRRKGKDLAELEVRPYDFKRPERVSKDQMRALENLHEGFGRSFGASLSGFLRTIVEVNTASIEQMTFSEFTHGLPNPTCFNLLSAEPLNGSMCLEMSPLIIYPIVDRLLGGTNADLFIPQRPLTAIEQRLVRKILDRAMVSLGEAWASIAPVEFKLEESESNPQLVQIVPPNEVVVVVGFELKMGGRTGSMNLCVPYAVIEPVVEKLSSQTWAGFGHHKRNAGLRLRVAEHLDMAKLSISAILADTTIKLSDLMNLEVGDIVMTEKPASGPLSLSIEGKRKYIGHLGQYRGNRAFKVKRALSVKDRV